MSVRSRLLTLLAALATIVLIVLLVVVPGRSHGSRGPRTLEIDVRARGTFAKLFWGADPQFADDRSIRVPLQPASDGFQRLRFPLPARGTRWLRFDPSDAPGEVLIGKVQLLDANGAVIAAMDGERFKPVSQSVSILRKCDVTQVV